MKAHDNSKTRRDFLHGGALSTVLFGFGVAPSAQAATISVEERDTLYRKAKEEETKSADREKLPDDAATKMFRDAQRAQQSGDIPKALVLTNQLVDKYPEFAYGYSNRGNLFVAMKKYNEALPDYNKALELAPASKEAWVILLNRATTLSLLDKDQEALKDFDAALALPRVQGPTEELVLTVNKALVEVKIKDYEGAKRDFEAAVKVNPTPDNFWSMYGLVLYQLGKDDQAYDILTQANKKLPPNSELKAALTALATTRGDIGAAETFWSDVQRTRSYSSKSFLVNDRHWPARAVEAMGKFRGKLFAP